MDDSLGWRVFNRRRDKWFSILARNLQIGKTSPSITRHHVKNVVMMLEGKRDLLQVITAGRTVGNLTDLQDSRDQQSDKRNNNPDHDKEFDQNHSVSLCSH
jgi:hypothetical protein